MFTSGSPNYCRLWPWGVCLLLLGCASVRPPYIPPPLPSLPHAHEVRAGACVLVSDVPFPPSPPLVRRLEGFAEEVCKELRLPTCTQITQVYLFADRPRYEAYMNCQFPELPYRRAYFIARTDPRRGEELCIYTFWGEHVLEDLRHELTHASLHGQLKNVPMWLDEGLAEYFESADGKGLNAAHMASLRENDDLANPTWPDLAALERLTEVAQMQASDYRASWGVVHWLLHGSPQGRELLLRYLQQLRQSAQPPPFAPLLREAIPHYEEAVRDHLHRLCPARVRRSFFASFLPQRSIVAQVPTPPGSRALNTLVVRHFR